MKNSSITLALVSALMLGVFGTAEARDRDRGAHKQRPAAVEQRASQRKFQAAVDRRQARQGSRIKQGRRSGQLNPRQVARLRNGQKHINRMERRFGADGHYTRTERRILKRKLRRADKRIWRMKGRHYGPRRGHGGKRRFHYHGRPQGVHDVRIYPVYQEVPGQSLGLDIETEAFRFSVNKSG